MYRDYYEVHAAEWEAAQEWLTYEADMATNPYGSAYPTASNIEAMYIESKARC